MLASLNISLSETLLAEVRIVADAEQRSVDEVMADAVKRYLEERAWASLLDYGQKQGEAVGITTDEGIDRAIADWRAENPPRGR